EVYEVGPVQQPGRGGQRAHGSGHVRLVEEVAAGRRGDGDVAVATPAELRRLGGGSDVREDVGDRGDLGAHGLETRTVGAVGEVEPSGGEHAADVRGELGGGHVHGGDVGSEDVSDDDVGGRVTERGELGAGVPHPEPELGRAGEVEPLPH